MLSRINRLFRKSRSWCGKTPTLGPVKKHRFRPQLEPLDVRLVPAAGLTAYYWTGAAGTNVGSNVNNWSVVANAQTAPAAAPGAGSALFFSNNYGAAGNNSNLSCQLTVANYGSINSTVAYTIPDWTRFMSPANWTCSSTARSPCAESSLRLR